MKKLLSLAVLATVLGVGVQSASALVINAVRIFPGSGIAFDFQNPSTSTVFVSSEVSATGLPPASPNSKVFIAEYAPDGTLLREVAVDSPYFDTVGRGGEVVVEGLSFFETSNLLFAETIEGESEGTPDEEEREFEFDHLREYTTTDIARVDAGLDFDLDETLDEFELEDVTFNPARDSVFVTGEVETGLVDAAVEIQFLFELDKTDGRILNTFNLSELSQFMHLGAFEAEGLGYNEQAEALLLAVNLGDENREGDTQAEHSVLLEISISENSLTIVNEIDLSSLFQIGEAEGVAYDHLTGTLFIAEEVDEEDVLQGVLDNPQPGSFASGMSTISGWHCNARLIEIQFDTGPRLPAASGTSRNDTEDKCGDSDTGFGLVFNCNLLGDGVHIVRAFANGIAFASATFTVTTLGTEFLGGVSAEFDLPDFPRKGETVSIRWEEALQGFVINAKQP